MTVPGKKCRKCGRERLFAEFYSDRTHSDGHTSRCRPCVNEDRDVYRSQRRETLAENAREYRKRTPERGCWHAMLARCYDEKSVGYKNYGGRGITVCAAWRESFEAFLIGVGPRPPGHTLDRLDVNGNYEPGNVQWATPRMQGRNMRYNRLITVGDVTRCLAEWSELTGHPPVRILDRIDKLGWDPERAIRTPLQGKGK